MTALLNYNSTIQLYPELVEGRGCPLSAVHALQDDGGALTDADAESGQRVFALNLLQLACGRQEDARSGRTQRVAECDGAAVLVDAAIRALLAEALKAGENLSGEGFIDLYHVHVVHGETSALQSLL